MKGGARQTRGSLRGGPRYEGRYQAGGKTPVHACAAWARTAGRRPGAGGAILEAQTPQVACTAVWPRPRSGQRPPRLSVCPTIFSHRAALPSIPFLQGWGFPAITHRFPGVCPSAAALTCLELFMYLHAGYVRRTLRVTRGALLSQAWGAAPAP